MPDKKKDVPEQTDNTPRPEDGLQDDVSQDPNWVNPDAVKEDDA